MENKNENQHTYDNGFHPKKVTLKPNYKFYNRSFIFIFVSVIIVTISTFVEWIIKHCFYGFKTTGKKNLKGNRKGKVIICNHCFPQDIFFLITALYPTKTYVTSLQSNFGFPIVSAYFRICAAVPIPEDRRLLRAFNDGTVDILHKKKNVVFFAEAALIPYCDHIRNFMPGAFHYAYNADSDILPMCYTFHKPKGIYKIFRGKKPSPRLNFLPVYKIEKTDNKSNDIKRITSEVHDIIEFYFNEHNEYKNGTYIKR